MAARAAFPTGILLRAAAPFALHALARETDAAVGMLLHTTLDLPRFVPVALGLVDPGHALVRAVLWAAAGLAAWGALGWARARAGGETLEAAAAAEAAALRPLYLRPVLTVAALLSLAVRPTYPYGFTLPVALTQDWGIAQDVAVVAALVAGHARLLRPLTRIPAPGPAGLGFVVFLAYALLTPESARLWEGHPGNEPKTLRMAIALGHGLTLDVEGVSAPMEALPVRPLAIAARQSASTLARESLRMAEALAHGPHAVGAQAIRATRITRQTIRGKDGGVFHVLAPGPSFLLAPTLRLDRALNLARGTAGRLAVTVLFWNALAAAAVVALFLLMREATGRAGLSAVVAGGLSLLPPYVFYSFQFYPEMLGALVLALALRLILFGDWRGGGIGPGLGLLLAVMPWLHQKFLPVWGVLVAMAVVRAVASLVTLRQLGWLMVPQAASLYLTLLYNFAVTGSARPDALFLAWGPGGVSSARMGQGLLGLLLDARYGLLPYVPVYLLAAGGIALRGPRAFALRGGAVAVAVYYVTVAAADNWSGAVCNLGRYIMPATPWAAALAALVVATLGRLPGVLAVALTLAGWSGLVGVALWRDPHAANDCAVLLARSAFADGNVYVPNLFLRSWGDAAPGLWARVAAWLVGLAILGLWLRRADRVSTEASPTRALFSLVAAILAAAGALEHWPATRTAARFPDALPAGPGVTAFVRDAQVEGAAAGIDPGAVDILVRSPDELPSLRLRIEGKGAVRLPGRPPLPVAGSGLELDVPLDRVVALQGRRGARETLSRRRIEVEGTGPFVLRALGPPGP